MPGEKQGKRIAAVLCVGLTSPIQFQLRVFCLVNGDLQLYLYQHAVVFFASVPYAALDADEDAFDRELGPHVTNPPRNPIDGSDIRLLHQLLGAPIASGTHQPQTKLEKIDIDSIMAQIQQTIADIFKAVQGNPVRFQVRRGHTLRVFCEPTA